MPPNTISPDRFEIKRTEQAAMAVKLSKKMIVEHDGKLMVTTLVLTTLSGLTGQILRVLRVYLYSQVSIRCFLCQII